MKDTPDSFDQFVKSKLEEVEINPVLANAYWQQMQLPAVKQTGTIKFRRYYWLGASVLLAVLVILTAIKKDKSVTSNANVTITQQLNKAAPINTYDTVITIDKKQADGSPALIELKETKKNNLNKSTFPKISVANTQVRDKLNFDSTLNHQTTIKLKALQQSKEEDTLSISKESTWQTGIQQANINLEKMDSLNKKPEAKKKAPHIIW